MTPTIETRSQPWSLDALREHRETILALAAEHGAYNVRVFGSIARGEATPDSDVDLLVSYAAGTSLWDAVGLWQALQDYLGCEVSLVGEDDRETRFLQRIKQEAVPL